MGDIKTSIQRNERSATILSKRLAYLLRYGAEKENLKVLEGGYISMEDLMKVPFLSMYSHTEVLGEVVNSISYRGVSRFELKHEGGKDFVRAPYARCMERNPYHDGSRILRLTETCMDFVCDRLSQFDMEGFPDEFLLNAMIHRLKRRKKLNNKALEHMLSSSLEHLDLNGVYLTEKSFKILGVKCPHLRVLSLKNCGFVITDHLMEILLKKLKNLECLNLLVCTHLTDRTLRAISKNIPNVRQLLLAHIPNLTQEGILNLVISCPKLQYLDIFDNKNLDVDGISTLVEIAKERKFMVIHKSIKDSDVAPDNPCALLANFGLTTPTQSVSNGM